MRFYRKKDFTAGQTPASHDALNIVGHFLAALRQASRLDGGGKFDWRGQLDDGDIVKSDSGIV